ncbi:baeRF2 domain-containing protein [Streptomyces sp. NPDC002851]
MKLRFLDPLYAQPGPYASVYVDTSRDVVAAGDWDRAIELHRRHARSDLIELGADPATADASAEAVGTDADVPGRHGQALFATHGEVVLTEELPQPPPVDRASYDLLPDAMPLALQHAPDIPYAAALLTRVPPDDSGTKAEELRVKLQTGRWPSSAVAPRALTHLHTPVHQWQQAAERLADELVHLIDHGHADTLVLCGDTWACGVLANRLPTSVRHRVATVPVSGDGDGVGGGGGGGVGDGGDVDGGVGVGDGEQTGRALLEPQLADLFRGRLSAHDLDRLEMFAAQRAHHATEEGLTSAVAALQRRQAEALLVNRSAEDWPPLWVSSDLEQIGLSAEELQTFGLTGYERQPADAALLHAAVTTGAELIVVPSDGPPLEDGIGVLRRY